MRRGRFLAGSTMVVVAAAVAIGSVTAGAAGPPGPAPEPAHGAAPWPAPPDPMRRTRMAGLTPEHHESFLHHVHAHLDVFVNGKHELVPAGIGINIKDPAVKRFTEPDGSTGYGGIQQCAQPCISPLHTHAGTGLLHTESASPIPNRLGQLFTEWGVALGRRCVGGYCRPSSIEFYVNGKPYLGDPRAILLTNHKEIAILIGTRPAKIPSTANWMTD